MIITHIFAGQTPAAMCQYLNPGCKITAINGESVKGLSHHEMITKLERAKTSVVLSIEEPTGFLFEGSSPPSRNTWPEETEHGFLYKSLSDRQIRYASAYSSVADNNLQRTDLTCQQNQQSTSDVVCDAKPMSLSVFGSMPPASDYNTGFINGASSSPGCRSVHQEPGTPHLVPPEQQKTPTDQDMPVCQGCKSITLRDKGKQTIEHIPGDIYHSMCLKLDSTSPFGHDYRDLGEKLGFSRAEISKLSNRDQPTDDLLKGWNARKGDRATVEVLLGVLHEIDRHDCWQSLQRWVEICSRCFAKQQVNEREVFL